MKRPNLARVLELLAPLKAVPTPDYPPPAVWICPECDDVYDSVPADGNCPNPGHAEVRLTFRSVRSLEPDKAKAR